MKNNNKKSWLKGIKNILSFKSNLAFALLCLPSNIRADMMVFYKYCRIVDDVADDPVAQPSLKKTALNYWKNIILEKKLNYKNEQINKFYNLNDWSSFSGELINLIKEKNIEKSKLIDIIKGVEMDLDEVKFQSIEELEKYCYLVAGVVGEVSLKIFNCKSDKSILYARVLGNALQLTNIIRDVKLDYNNEERIYIPEELIVKHNFSRETFIEFLENKHDGENNINFINLLRELCNKAESYYKKSDELFPHEDKKKLKSAILMRKIYYNLLIRIKKDNFKVLSKSYKPNKMMMIVYLLKSFLK